MKDNKPRLSVFETFKTKREQLTGEATRQRSIIFHLATTTNQAGKTRTAISQKIAKENGIAWKNIYSGIFRDMDEILIPLNLVKEAGRLPLKRGPRALQEKGIPFYDLSPEGLLIALSLREIESKKEIFDRFVSQANIEDEEFLQSLQKLVKNVPKFAFHIFEKYSRAYCEGKIANLFPFGPSNIRKLNDESLSTQKEFLEAFGKMSNSEREKILKFLKEIS